MQLTYLQALNMKSMSLCMIAVKDLVISCMPLAHHIL